VRGEGGGLNIPLPIPFNPGYSRHIFVALPRFTFSIAKYCTILSNFALSFPLPATLGIPLPEPSTPSFRTPPALFSPRLPPPCPPKLCYKASSRDFSFSIQISNKYKSKMGTKFTHIRRLTQLLTETFVNNDWL